MYFSVFAFRLQMGKESSPFLSTKDPTQKYPELAFSPKSSCTVTHKTLFPNFLNMSRLTRSSGHVQPMEVVKPAESTRSRRAFGRDITNAAPEPVSSKVVTKPHVFTALNTDLYSAVSESKDDGSKSLFKDPREYMNRSLDDIDSRDAGNPLLCTEYVNDMYQHFHVQEKECLISPIYIKTLQTHVTEKMRTILVDWMVEVHVKFKQVPETLYLTIQLIDRYLQVKCVRRSKLQLVGVACNLVSARAHTRCCCCFPRTEPRCLVRVPAAHD